MRRCSSRGLSRSLSLGLPLAAAGLLSGCYPAQPVLYSPGSQYYQPQYGQPPYGSPQNPPQYPPQYPPPGYSSPASPEPAPPPPETTYDTRPAEPFSPAIVEPSAPSPPAAADDDAFLLPKTGGGTGNTGDVPAPPAPPGPATRTVVPRNSVPLMGFRPMRGQQGS